MGYIKPITNNNGKLYLNIDKVDLLNGEEAINRAIQETGCAKEKINYGGCATSLNNGFYISNPVKTYVDYEVLNNVITTKGSVTDFNSYYKDNFNNTLFSITLENNKVVSVKEVYLP